MICVSHSWGWSQRWDQSPHSTHTWQQQTVGVWTSRPFPTCAWSHKCYCEERNLCWVCVWDGLQSASSRPSKSSSTALVGTKSSDARRHTWVTISASDTENDLMAKPRDMNTYWTIKWDLKTLFWSWSVSHICDHEECFSSNKSLFNGCIIFL